MTAAFAALAFAATGAAADFLGDSPLRFDIAQSDQPAVPQPPPGGQFTDPVFGTTVRRLSATADPGDNGTTGTVPEYSKAQAWNADGTRLLLHGTDGSWRMHDGNTLAFVNRPAIPVGDVEPRWSPTNPDQLTYVLDDSIFRFSVAKNRARRIARFRGLGPLSSGAEQERSADGRYFAVHGPIKEGSRGRFVSTRAFVVDLKTGRRGRIRTLRPPRGYRDDFLDWVAVTPDGQRVVAMWAFYGAVMYTRNWHFVRRLTDWDEHGDFCRTASGRVELVIAHYRSAYNDEVVEAIPLDGSSRRILWKAPAFNLALHISCRNTRLPGWAFISSYWDGLGQRPGPTAFENEVFALGLDSTEASPVVRRLAHTRMTERADYFDEPHATVRQDGRMVLFASNFGRFVSDPDYDDTYLIDLR